MPQLTLFDPGDRVLVDDERGRIAYTPRFVDAATAASWFAELRRDVVAEPGVVIDAEPRGQGFDDVVHALAGE